MLSIVFFEESLQSWALLIFMSSVARSAKRFQDHAVAKIGQEQTHTQTHELIAIALLLHAGVNKQNKQ